MYIRCSVRRRRREGEEKGIGVRERFYMYYYIVLYIYVLYMLQNNIKYLLLIFTYEHLIFDTLK